MRRLATGVVLLALVTGLGRTVAADAAAWHRELHMVGGLPAIDVQIDGRGPFRFALDTGAEGSTVGTELASRLGLRPHAAVELVSVAGTRKLPLVRLSGVRLGPDAPSEEVEAAVSDLRVMRTAGEVDGVLGSDLLGRWDYLLDFADGTLALSRTGRVPEGGLTLQLTLHRGRPLVRWPVGGVGELTLVLDSGADALMIDREVARRLPLHGCRDGSVETNAGGREVEICELRRLALATLTLDRLRVVPLPWPSRDVRPDVGLLPASLFARVQVSNSRRTVTVWPNASNARAAADRAQ